MGLKTIDLFKNLNAGIALDNDELCLLQQTVISIADDIIEVCEENNLSYFLCGGSALGAVRHNGFIPWDDDMDLAMTRRDCERFLPMFEEKYGNKYWIHSPQSESEHSISHICVRLKGTSFRTRDDFNPDECGVFVDITIVENTFDNVIMRNIHGFGAMAFGLVISCRRFPKTSMLLSELAHDEPEVLKTIRIKTRLGKLFSFFSLQRWIRLGDKWHAICKNDKSGWVSLPTGRKHFFGELYRREGMCKTQKMSFEGREWNVPLDVDGYLKQLYGDYMKIPPVEERERHLILEFKL